MSLLYRINQWYNRVWCKLLSPVLGVGIVTGISVNIRMGKSVGVGMIIGVNDGVDMHCKRESRYGHGHRYDASLSLRPFAASGRHWSLSDEVGVYRY